MVRMMDWLAWRPCAGASRLKCWSRRDGVAYRHTHAEILAKYGPAMKMCDRMPDALAMDMGNQMYVVNVDTAAEREAFIRFVQERV